MDIYRSEVGRLARRLGEGYYSFLIAHHIAVDPRAINLLPQPTRADRHPVGDVKRKDGTRHVFDLRHYLDLLREDRSLQEDIFLRLWVSGAILNLGDVLKDHKYFDHAPILELVYHLRNGIAHGNRFAVTDDGQKRLAKYPAHNRDARVKSPAGTVFEITPHLAGRIIFEFMGPGDFIDLLFSVECHLTGDDAEEP